MTINGKLDILFIPFVGIGHVNACIGIAEVLSNSGHRVTFAISEQFEGLLQKYGFCELLLPEVEDRPKDVDPGLILADIFLKLGNVFADLSPLEKISQRGVGMNMRVEYYIKLDKTIDGLLKMSKPDVIILDQLMSLPSVEISGIPYVWCWSTNPLLMVDDERTPPSGSGLSAFGDSNDWKVFREIRDKTFRDAWNRFNDYVLSKGCLPLKPYAFSNRSQCLNIYGYPKELDYLDIRPLPKNYIRFDNLKREDIHSSFEIPVQLNGRPGSLIYFSLGSMGGVDVENMQRLVSILAKSPNRFIISKGPKHNEYTLAENMWGQKSVPQIQVLPMVDLVITHGGNNTITETFYFGKPMIVMPLFGDQYDNAQRVEEMGFGFRLDVYKCTEKQLLSAIEQLLEDRDLKERMIQISKRIQSESSIKQLPQIIEDFVKNFQNNKIL